MGWSGVVIGLWGMKNWRVGGLGGWVVWCSSSRLVRRGLGGVGRKGGGGMGKKRGGGGMGKKRGDLERDLLLAWWMNWY